MRQDTPQMWLVQKIFPADFNPHCDLDRENSNQKLPQNIPAHDDAPLYHVWLQKFQKLERYGTYFWKDFSPYRDRNPNFLQDTPSHDDTPAYQVSLQKVKWFRRYQSDKYSLRIWTLTVTLTLGTGNGHKTLWFRMMRWWNGLAFIRVKLCRYYYQWHSTFQIGLRHDFWHKTTKDCDSRIHKFLHKIKSKEKK